MQRWKYRSVWAIALLGLLVYVTAEATVKPGRGKPKIHLSPEVFDFGYMPPNAKVTYRYWLANIGSDTLVVTDVKPQCGCTTVPLPGNRIGPSDSVALDLVLDAKNIIGVINKSVTIYSNDSTQNPTVIYFTARVQSPDSTVAVSPPSALLETIDKSAEVITLTNHTQGPYRVQVKSPPSPYIAYEMSSDVAEPGAAITITLRRTKQTPVGPFLTSLTLMLDGSYPHPVTIPIRGIGYVE